MRFQWDWPHNNARAATNQLDRPHCEAQKISLKEIKSAETNITILLCGKNCQISLIWTQLRCAEMIAFYYVIWRHRWRRWVVANNGDCVHVAYMCWRAGIISSVKICRLLPYMIPMVRRQCAQKYTVVLLARSCDLSLPVVFVDTIFQGGRSA